VGEEMWINVDYGNVDNEIIRINEAERQKKIRRQIS
jgi:hypothetical protein